MRPSVVFGISGLSSVGDCSSTLGLISMVPFPSLHAARSLLKTPTRPKSQGCRALPYERSRGGGRQREEQPAGADRAGGAVSLAICPWEQASTPDRARAVSRSA